MDEAPLFELPDIHTGESYHLEKDLGKIIVLTFWTSWCPDCAKDLPLKEKLHQSMDADKVKMITINVTGREREQGEGTRFAEKFLSQLTLKDVDRTVYDQYGCTGVPTTIIITQEGDIAAHLNDQTSFLTIVEKIGNMLS
ncbi:TlpA family protein disulfide reductase [Thalassobacillus pellis]|uniref:TlpA family protein disulfide reductase n=1 Tax=Thalassobacillus pellis TaxID=748008 RepID=UPI0019607AE5|nr:TlpA disulfide reductase family protein [Thalassobacillus pellis]MBM7551263.1 thiol-disulfide isomerase/thioredoxin [Thalassobacillus pellis]